MRVPPPPPSSSDPYHRLPPSVPPPPPSHPWPYSATQFQYQFQTQYSPSPPPPQWPASQSSNHAPHPPPHYPVPQPPPFHAHPHYPTTHPLPPRPPHAPESYPPDWGSSWTPQQSWQYPTNNNEEDWGAKAKAWLAAKAAAENQNPFPQFVTGGVTEDKYQYREQYSQSNDPHTKLASASNYQHYPGAMEPANQTDLSQSQETQYAYSGQSSYGADMRVAFSARDGSHAGDSIAPINPLVHQQEVPSSYSSVAGNEEVGDRYEEFNSSSSLPVAPLPHQHVQPPPLGRAGWMEEPQNFGSMPTGSASDLRDQPLNLAPQFTSNLDPLAQLNYNHSLGAVGGGEPTVAISSKYAWPSSTAPGAACPPLPPSIPSVAQVDHPIAMPSPASGHPAPMFPTGPTFQPTIPMMGATFSVGAVVTPSPTAFLGDAYGVSDRPKKASVPDWLREEIIKNKAVITSSAPEIPKDDSQSAEEDSIDKSSRKGYQVDSKSIDSSRSTEDDDEDENEVEAARTAAINLEIKRVLTEVLLKVTDELFDEIATNVLKEDDLTVEVGHDVSLSDHQILPTMQSVSTPKASAKILIPIKTKESDYEDASVKSTSAPPGDILGLGSYASDEEDEDIQSNSKESSTQLQSSSAKHFKGNYVNENGSSMEATKVQLNFPAKLDSDNTGKKSPVSATLDGGVVNMDFSDYKEAGDLASNDDGHSSKRFSWIIEDELRHEPDISLLNNSLDKKIEKYEDANSDAGRVANDDSGIQDTLNQYDKNYNIEHKRSSGNKEPKDSESSKEGLDKKDSEEYGRHSRTERTDYYNTSKGKGKEKGKTDEKVNNSESRKRLHPSGCKEGTTETQIEKISSRKEDDNNRREDRKRDEKREHSRHKIESKSSRHKRRRSSSVGARDRGSKGNSVINRANDSSDESLNDSRRKSHDSRHSERRKCSSPVRSRKRQVSQSPHSKHSNRWHSPYSSLDTTRGKRSASRSRSRSPVHRRR